MFGSGPCGKGIFRIPNRFKPISIAKTATKVGKNSGTWPYILPNIPLILPSIVNERTMPPQKLKLREKGLSLFLNPAKKATVIGRRDIEHGLKLVSNPPKKAIINEIGLGLLSP